MENIEIYGDRKQLIRPAIQGGLFLLFGAVLFILSDAYASQIGSEVVLVKILCIISMLYWAINLLRLGCTCIRYRKPQLILTPKGLTLRNDGNNRPYEIQWRQITGVEEYLHKKLPSIILIQVADPRQAIDAEPGKARRREMEGDLRTYGTPFYLRPSTLKYPKGELTALLKHLHEQYGHPWTNPN